MEIRVGGKRIPADADDQAMLSSTNAGLNV